MNARRSDPAKSDPRQAAARTPLTRELIVARAVDFIDRRGITALTMRALGLEIGVEAMSLYRYVNGREDLLEAIVDELVDGIRLESVHQLQPTDGWQAYLQWLANTVRAQAIEHPSIFPLIATRHPSAPWLRPPLRSLRVVEEFLTALTSRGFTDAQAVEAYRSFSSFLLGQLLLEVSTAGAETAPVEEPLDEGDADIPNSDEDLSLADYPHVKRLRPQLSEDRSQDEFERGLEMLLDRMDLQLSQ